MKKINTIAILSATIIALNAAELIRDGYYPLDKIPEKAEISMSIKDDFEFKMEENITTGYTWQARYNPAEVKVEIEHDINKKHKQLGAAGHADIEIELLKKQSAIIEFYYSRPFEKDSKAIKTMTCTIEPIEKSSKTTQKEVIDSSILPILQDDVYLKLKNLPQAMQITLPIGKDLSFELEEDDRNLHFWNIASAPTEIAEIEIEHDESGLFFNNSHAEIEIEPKKSGTYKLDLVYAKDTPLEKHFSLYLEVISKSFGTNLMR